MEDYEVRLPAELVALVDAYGDEAAREGLDYDASRVTAARTALIESIARAVSDAWCEGMSGGQNPITR